jgi:hypothetical protein
MATPEWHATGPRPARSRRGRLPAWSPTAQGPEGELEPKPEFSRRRKRSSAEGKAVRARLLRKRSSEGEGFSIPGPGHESPATGARVGLSITPEGACPRRRALSPGHPNGRVEASSVGGCEAEVRHQYRIPSRLPEGVLSVSMSLTKALISNSGDKSFQGIVSEFNVQMYWKPHSRAFISASSRAWAI